MFHCHADATGSNASQRDKELDREERIAAGLFLDQLGQRPREFRLAVERVGDEPANVVELEGLQHDLMHPSIGRPDRLQGPQQRVRGADLVVPVRADQQQVTHFRVRNQMREEVERC